MNEEMKPQIEWTDDCGGKKDYDGSIISVSTRYWPKGGGFLVFDPSNPDKGFQGNETRPEIKPSANSTIILDSFGGGIELASMKFEGQSESEVKLQVEKWVQSQFEIIIELLRHKFDLGQETNS